jgi:hypothetical protein
MRPPDQARCTLPGRLFIRVRGGGALRTSLLQAARLESSLHSLGRALKWFRFTPKRRGEVLMGLKEALVTIAGFAGGFVSDSPKKRTSC